MQKNNWRLFGSIACMTGLALLAGCENGEDSASSMAANEPALALVSDAGAKGSCADKADCDAECKTKCDATRATATKDGAGCHASGAEAMTVSDDADKGSCRKTCPSSAKTVSTKSGCESTCTKSKEASDCDATKDAAETTAAKDEVQTEG